MLDSITSVVIGHWPTTLLILVIAYSARNYFNHNLNKYPGPFLASLTDWWRFFEVCGRRSEVTHINLHRKHGDVVRLGPNVLSFADPAAIKQIYGLNKGFVKSEFYPVQMAVSKGNRLPSLFSTTNEAFHANLRRSVSSAFTMSALVQYEPFVDEVVEIFLRQSENIFAKTNKICDFAEWLQFFAFDVIGQITYSKRHGFIDRYEDVDGIVKYLGSLFSYVAPIGQMPWLDLLLLKNPVLRLLDQYGIMNFSSAVATFARTRMQERLAEMTSKKAAGIDQFANRRPDLMSIFLRAQMERPGFMTDQRVLTMLTSMSFAGSETTGISLSAVFYYLLKNPRCYHVLMQELDEGIRFGKIQSRTSGLVSWSESQTLPYLDACIKEAFRIHPAAGLPLERVTPPQGAEICGRNIAGGTIVGCSAWVIHHRPEIYGDDADHYRPERWLEADEDRLKEMSSSMFHFGAGPRTCIGKNISLLEIYKLVPSFLRRFEVTLARPDEEWQLHNAWFVKQLNFHTRFTSRKLASEATRTLEERQ